MMKYIVSFFALSFLSLTFITISSYALVKKTQDKVSKSRITQRIGSGGIGTMRPDCDKLKSNFIDSCVNGWIFPGQSGIATCVSVAKTTSEPCGWDCMCELNN